jgi:hypothetical protein
MPIPQGSATAGLVEEGGKSGNKQGKGRPRDRIYLYLELLKIFAGRRIFLKGDAGK